MFTMDSWTENLYFTLANKKRKKKNSNNFKLIMKLENQIFVKMGTFFGISYYSLKPKCQDDEKKRGQWCVCAEV